MIKLVQSGIVHEDVRRIAHALNFSEAALPFPIGPGEPAVVDAGSVMDVGGFSVDRSVFRKLLPDARWYLYAAGRVDPADADGVTISMAYVTNANAIVVLGSITPTGAGFTKQTLGPFSLFATGGVPAGETVVTIRLQAQKLVSGTATLRDWCVWLRLLPSGV